MTRVLREQYEATYSVYGFDAGESARYESTTDESGTGYAASGNAGQSYLSPKLLLIALPSR